MKRNIVWWLVLLIAVLLIASQPAASQTPTLKSQLYTDITTNFPDNTTGFITPSRVRGVLNNMVASWQQWSTVNAQTGTTYTVAATDLGKFITFNNAAPVAVTIPAPGASFPTGWSVFVKNVGLGAVTITPASGTIGGAANVALNNGQGLFIDSDGVNWQTWGGSGTGTVTSVTCGKNLSGGTITLTGTCDLFNAPTLGVSGTTLGTIGFYGNTSGLITVQPQAVAGTYNFNLPTSAGTSGLPLLSGGGGASRMTFSQLNLASAVTGNISTANFNSGTGANTSAFWRGDGTWSSTVEGNAGTMRLRISADAGQARILSWASADVARWAVRVDGAESTSTSGADFSIRRYVDAGTFLDTPLYIPRSTGVVSFGAGAISIPGSSSGTVRVQSQAAAGTPTLTLPTQTGTFVATAAAPLSINATTGQISITTGTLSRVDDTNVTLTLGGTPTNALLNAVSITAGWSGQLSVARGGTGCGAASGTCIDNISGFSSTGIMSRTGAATYTFSTLTALIDSGVCSTQGSAIYRNASDWVCLTPGSSGQVFTTGGAGSNPSWTSVAGTGTVTSVSQGTGMSFSVNPITTSGTVNADIASATDYYSATSNKLLDAAVLSQAETITTYANSPTTFDLNTFVNTRVVLTGGISTITFSNLRAGRCGNVRFLQDVTGNRQISAGAFPTTFHFPSQTSPVLSTGTSAVDIMPFCCVSSTYCVGNLIKNIGQ